MKSIPGKGANHSNGSVVVAGAGIVGLTTAVLFSEAGLDVKVFDPTTTDDLPDSGFERRQYALSPAARQLLADCGAWERLAADRIATVNGMEVWDSPSNGHIRFRAPDTDGVFGYMVEHGNLTQALWQRAAALGVEHVAESISTLQQQQSGIEVRGSGSATKHASLLIGADGSHSTVRTLLGVDAERSPYRQRALVANIDC